MEIGVDEPDYAARSLYETFGFTNREGGGNGPVMYLYERDLNDTNMNLPRINGSTRSTGESGF
jgi:hypothetical protein